MKSIISFSKVYMVPFIFIFIFLMSAPWAGTSFAENEIPQTPGKTAVDEARAVFGRLDNYLKNDAIQFSTSYDAQNISLGASRGTARFSVERPNLLRVELSGDGFSYLMTSDGKVLTIYDEKKNKYAQRPAPERPIEAVNLFTGLAAFQARVPQFFGLVGDVASENSDLTVSKEGIDSVGGLKCVRYNIQRAPRADSEQWTVWLRDDSLPLPCKTFIRNLDEGLQQTNQYTWINEASQSDKFSFTPPRGSKEVSIGELALRPLQ